MKRMIGGFDVKTLVVYAFILYVYALAIYCLYQGPIIELVGYGILFIINAIFSYFLMRDANDGLIEVFSLKTFNESRPIAASIISLMIIIFGIITYLYLIQLYAMNIFVKSILFAVSISTWLIIYINKIPFNVVIAGTLALNTIPLIFVAIALMKLNPIAPTIITEPPQPNSYITDVQRSKYDAFKIIYIYTTLLIATLALMTMIDYQTDKRYVVLILLFPALFYNIYLTNNIIGFI